jgi:uncharacterized protein (TIGR03000 family)
MVGISWKPLVVGAVVAATLALGVSQADACWRCGAYYPVSWGYTAYYTPCYTSCCTVSCDPCWSGGGWYLGYRPGPIRRLLFGPYRWYYGGWDYSWSSSSFDTCCTGVGTVAPTVAPRPTPTEAQKPVLPEEPSGALVPPLTIPGGTLPGGTEPAVEPPGKAPEPPADTAPSTSNARENSGLLTIYVPYDAKIEVNGLPTRSEGSRRQYVSYGLRPGFSYKYEVRAEVVRDGKVVEDVRTVTLTAGDREMVTFGFNPSPAQEVASR